MRELSEKDDLGLQGHILGDQDFSPINSQSERSLKSSLNSLNREYDWNKMKTIDQNNDFGGTLQNYQWADNLEGKGKEASSKKIHIVPGKSSIYEPVSSPIQTRQVKTRGELQNNLGKNK